MIKIQGNLHVIIQFGSRKDGEKQYEPKIKKPSFVLYAWKTGYHVR